MISYTTRKRRPNEGNTHIFTDIKTFNLIKSDLVAFTSFSGNFYGVDSKAIDDNDLYTIDLNGIDYFEKHYNGKKMFKIVYIDTAESECHMRMIMRGDSHIEIAKRLAYDKKAFENADKIADFVVKNDSFDSCVKSIYQYIMKCENGVNEGDNT